MLRASTVKLMRQALPPLMLMVALFAAPDGSEGAAARGSWPCKMTSIALPSSHSASSVYFPPGCGATGIQAK